MSFSDAPVPEVECPHCHHIIDRAMFTRQSDEEVLPENNDLSLCAYCAEPSFYVVTRTLRMPTDEEAKELSESRKFRAIQTLLRATRKAFDDIEADAKGEEQVAEEVVADVLAAQGQEPR